jgi:hypothetical protein
MCSPGCPRWRWSTWPCSAPPLMWRWWRRGCVS